MCNISRGMRWGNRLGSLTLVGWERSLFRCADTWFVKSVGKVCNISRGMRWGNRLGSLSLVGSKEVCFGVLVPDLLNQ